MAGDQRGTCVIRQTAGAKLMQMAHGFLYTAVAVVLLTGVGNWACRGLFLLSGFKNSNDNSERKAHPAGWIIGWLERLILAIGIVTHSWEVLAAVIALKSVARFKNLDKQQFAEYFLVGSLFSVLWAIIITSGWLAYDHRFGINISANVTKLIEVPDQAKNVDIPRVTKAPPAVDKSPKK